MLIDGIVKRYSTAMVELDTPYFSGRSKVLCMDNPVQDIIIGNIPGASGVHPNLVNTKATVTPDKVDSTHYSCVVPHMGNWTWLLLDHSSVT